MHTRGRGPARGREAADKSCNSTSAERMDGDCDPTGSGGRLAALGPTRTRQPRWPAGPRPARRSSTTPSGSAPPWFSPPRDQLRDLHEQTPGPDDRDGPPTACRARRPADRHMRDGGDGEERRGDDLVGQGARLRDGTAERGCPDREHDVGGSARTPSPTASPKSDRGARANEAHACEARGKELRKRHRGDHRDAAIADQVHGGGGEHDGGHRHDGASANTGRVSSCARPILHLLLPSCSAPESVPNPLLSGVLRRSL